MISYTLFATETDGKFFITEKHLKGPSLLGPQIVIKSDHFTREFHYKIK